MTGPGDPNYQPGLLLQQGQLLMRNFKITGRTGSPGGMGQVFLAVDTRLDRQVEAAALEVTEQRLVIASAFGKEDPVDATANPQGRLLKAPHRPLAPAAIDDHRVRGGPGPTRGTESRAAPSWRRTSTPAAATGSAPQCRRRCGGWT